MKAYLIDPYANTVSEVEFNGDFRHIYELIGCQAFDVATVERNQDCIYVDDEGLLTLTPETRFFVYEGYPNPLAGKGLMLGTNSRGDSVPPKTALETVRAKVSFLSLWEVRRFAGCDFS